MVLLNPLWPGLDTDGRAAEAESAVRARFVGRYLHLPGTRTGRTTAPGGGLAGGARATIGWRAPFHYWWQAHLLDCTVDGGLRRMRGGDVAGAQSSAALGRRILRTIALRNRLTFRNNYYDDMAWLALAAQRLDGLHEQLGRSAGLATRRWAQRTLTRELLSGRAPTGGMFWNKERNFVNAAASGPVALHLARSGRTAEARAILEWLYDHLLDERGLFIDGLRASGKVERHVFTYNQGPTLSTLRELGGDKDLRRAETLIKAVGAHLTEPSAAVLQTHGKGDGGLFTGILLRHLAAAARDPRLSRQSCAEAGNLVRATATALWDGRDSHGVFPVLMGARGSGASQRKDRVELSTQLQGWMAAEAHAVLDA